jgi:peptide/nickel transport system substrate-binding protein
MYKYRLLFVCSLALLVAACSAVESPLPVIPTPTSTQTESPTNTAPRPDLTNTPLPSANPEPLTLTICLGAEPDTLWLYGSNMLVKNTVLEAIYDGPIDPLGFDYQPVILEKLPSLWSNDARIEQVSVEVGDWVVNDSGEPVMLKVGEKVRPFGCDRTDCAIEWNAEPLQMAQLSADFTLLEGIKWSDGEPLTAADSVFSYQTAVACEDRWGYCGHNGLLPSNPGLDASRRTAGYEALDELRVRWVGMPGFLDPHYRKNFFIPLPVHRLKGLSLEELIESEESAEKPMGWGPYVIERYEFGDQIRLHKNPNYFRAEEGLPRYDELVFRFVGNDLDRNLNYLSAGVCDLLDQEASWVTDTLTLTDLSALDAQGMIALHHSNGTVWEHLDFSLLHADYDDGYQIGIDRPDFFGDVRTRRAVAMCLDWNRLFQEVPDLRLADRPSSYLPPNHPLFNNNTERYEFDFLGANRLLDEVGWIDHDGDPGTPRVARNVYNIPDGTLLTFTYRTTTAQQRQDIAAAIMGSVKDCGIQVNIEYINSNEFFSDPPEGDLFGRRFDLAQFAWLTGVLPPCDLFVTDNIPGDPATSNPDGTPRFPRGWQGQNNSGYSNPEFDLACQSAWETLPGQLGYYENHMLAQEIFARDLPVIPLFLRVKHTITRPDFCGHWMDPTADSDTWNIEEYQFGEGCKSDAEGTKETLNQTGKRIELTYYEVQAGETIFDIAKKHDISPEGILHSNEIPPHVLIPGMVLIIPPIDGFYYTWKDGDDLTALAHRFGVSINSILTWPENGGIHVTDEIETGKLLFIPGGTYSFDYLSTPFAPLAVSTPTP